MTGQPGRPSRPCARGGCEQPSGNTASRLVPSTLAARRPLPPNSYALEQRKKGVAAGRRSESLRVHVSALRKGSPVPARNDIAQQKAGPPPRQDNEPQERAPERVSALHTPRPAGAPWAHAPSAAWSSAAATLFPRKLDRARLRCVRRILLSCIIAAPGQTRTIATSQPPPLANDWQQGTLCGSPREDSGSSHLKVVTTWPAHSGTTREQGRHYGQRQRS